MSINDLPKWKKLAQDALDIHYGGPVNSTPLAGIAFEAARSALQIAGTDAQLPEYAPYRLILNTLCELAGIWAAYDKKAQDIEWCKDIILKAEAASL